MPAATSAPQPAGSGSATGGGAQHASRATGEPSGSGQFSSALNTAGSRAGSSAEASAHSPQPPRPPAQAAHGGGDAAASSSATPARIHVEPAALLPSGSLELPAAALTAAKGATRHARTATKDSKGKSANGAARGAGTVAGAAAPARVDLGALAALLVDARPSAPGACTEAGSGRAPSSPATPAGGCASAASTAQAVLAQPSSTAATPTQHEPSHAVSGRVDTLVGALTTAGTGGRHEAHARASARGAPALEPAPAVNAGAATARAPGAALSRQLSMQRFIAADVGTPGWSQALGAEVQWLCAQGVHAATVRLSPPHLGPVEVRINLQSAQVNVSFSAAHPDTRSALQQAVPTLRSMFANSGLTLGQATVQHEHQSGSNRARSRPGRTAVAGTADATSVAPSAGASRVGLVDEYV